MKYSEGDRVEIYIPTADEPEHRYHGHTGEIVSVLEDDLSDLTETPGRGYLYTVSFEASDLEEADFRSDDLHPVDSG